MSNELEQAAREASEALGMSVEVTEVVINQPTIYHRGLGYLVEVHAPLDSDTAGPVNGPGHELPYHIALAYLEGLECGARVVRVKHEALRERASEVCAIYHDGATASTADGRELERFETRRRLAAALAELEG